MSQGPKLEQKSEVIAPGHTLSSVTDKITKLVLTRAPIANTYGD